MSDPRPVVAHVATISLSLKYLLLNQLKDIAASGYQVVAISSQGEEVVLLQSEGIDHFGVEMTRKLTPLRDTLSLWHLFQLMRRQRFQIVHTHNPKPGLLGQLAARLAGIPIVVNTIHGFYFTNHTNPLARRLFIMMEKVAASCSDVIWSQSREDIDTAIQERICPPGKIRYLGNGIDLNRFDRSQIDSAVVNHKKQELGLKLDRPTVGFVGRLVSEKGVHELMQAALIVRQAIDDVQFVIVGPTDSEKPDAITDRIVHQYGLDGSCVFAGLRDDMPDLYAMMDVFVLPSHREGLPRAPMEASAMQVPCVVTDVRGCREVVINGLNGLVVPLLDVEALARAILELLHDHEWAAELGRNGRLLAEERFDERLVFSLIKTEYARLLQEKGLQVPQQLVQQVGL